MGVNVRCILVVLVGLIVLSSCKSTQLSTKSESELKSLTIERDSLNTNLNELIDWKELFTSSTSVIVEEIEYDTDKDVLDTTSKPPIKKETKTTYENNQSKNTSQATNKAVIDNQVKTKVADIDSKETTKTKEAINKTNPLKYVNGIVWALVVLLLIFIAYKLFKRFKVL